MVIMSLLLFACMVAFVIVLTWGLWQRDMRIDADELAEVWRMRAQNAERQLPAFRAWPELTDPGITQTIRIFDEWGPRNQ